MSLVFETIRREGGICPGDVPWRGNVRRPSVILSDLFNLGSDLNAATAETSVFQSRGTGDGTTSHMKAEQSSVMRTFGLFDL